MLNNKDLNRTNDCSNYSGKKCDGKLHSYAPIYYDDDPLYVRYKCKCDKCGFEIILNYDPDLNKNNYKKF